MLSVKTNIMLKIVSHEDTLFGTSDVLTANIGRVSTTEVLSQIRVQDLITILPS